jgi:hypothetical protein
MLVTVDQLTDEQIEAIERQALGWITQALLDYAPDIWDEFRNSPDADGVRTPTRDRGTATPGARPLGSP